MIYPLLINDFQLFTSLTNYSDAFDIQKVLQEIRENKTKEESVSGVSV